MENLRIYQSAVALDSFTIVELAVHCGANVNTVRSLLTNRSRDLFEVVGYQPRRGRGRRPQLFRVRDREAMQGILRAQQAPLSDGPGTPRGATASGVADMAQGPAEQSVSVDAPRVGDHAAVALDDGPGTDLTPRSASASGVVDTAEGPAEQSVSVDASRAGDRAAVALLDRPVTGLRLRRATASEGIDIRALCADDEIAWTRLIERFGPILRGICRSYRLSPSDVDDVMQATWLRLHQHIHGIREPSAIAGWLATTARRESLRVLQAHLREPATETLADAPGGVQPETELLAAERRAVLNRALRTLPERHRRLMTMLVSDPAPDYEELSTVLAMPIGSIGSLRARSLARLQRHPELRSFSSEHG
jgi:RNA polymerase sigma factor (sigma-70 family)